MKSCEVQIETLNLIVEMKFYISCTASRDVLCVLLNHDSLDGCLACPIFAIMKDGRSSEHPSLWL